MSDYIETGKVVNTHGLKGFVKIQPWCDEPEFLLNFSRFYLDALGAEVLEVEQMRLQKGMAIAKFCGYDSIGQSMLLKNRVVFIRRADIELPRGRYFVADLIGLEVADAESGKIYGTLSDVIRAGSRDVYSVRGSEGKELLFPAIPEVIKKVDMEKRRMEIIPLEGLFDQ